VSDKPTRTEANQKPRAAACSSSVTDTIAGYRETSTFKKVISAVTNDRLSVFLTGDAGTGKSTLLRRLIEESRVKDRRVAVLAPTGCAAVNVGGQTIHSFFSIPPRFIAPQEPLQPRNRQLLRDLDTLFIDEVSMVRADIMAAVDRSLREARREYGSPFGGLQVVLVGDLAQLPPVVRKEEAAFFGVEYPGTYFFQTGDFPRMHFFLAELQEPFRHQDDRFREILTNLRNNTLSASDLDELNQRVDERNDLAFRNSTVTLTGRNDVANDINARMLDQLPGPSVRFEAVVEGDFPESFFPVDDLLLLKPDAKIMMARNDAAQRWVNGTLGRVAHVETGRVQVEIDGSLHLVEPEKWENIRYQYDPATRKLTHNVIGTFAQMPIRLAWAMTIHKSQGQTLDRGHIEMRHRAFAHGQTYVALSRCRTLGGLTMARPLRQSDIVVDPQATGYREYLQPLD
jgi:ATP-dependent DNA helicase PIF1